MVTPSSSYLFHNKTPIYFLFTCRSTTQQKQLLMFYLLFVMNSWLRFFSQLVFVYIDEIHYCLFKRRNNRVQHFIAALYVIRETIENDQLYASRYELLTKPNHYWFLFYNNLYNNNKVKQQTFSPNVNAQYSTVNEHHQYHQITSI